MKKVSKSIDINASVERVYEFLTHPTNLPSVWPSLVEVSNVNRTSDGNHSFDWIYKMVGIRMHGHSATVRVEPQKYVESRTEGGIASTFRWRYEAIDSGTRLSVDVEYTIPLAVIGRAAEFVVAKVNEHETETLLANTKAILEHASTAPRPSDGEPVATVRP